MERARAAAAAVVVVVVGMRFMCRPCEPVCTIRTGLRELYTNFGYAYMGNTHAAGVDGLPGVAPAAAASWLACAAAQAAEQ